MRISDWSSDVCSSDLDDFKLKNISAYRKVKFHSSVDIDGLPVPLLLVEYVYRQNQVSEELKLKGKIGLIDFVVGGYYFREHGTTINYPTVSDVDTARVDPNRVLQGAYNKSEERRVGQERVR